MAMAKMGAASMNTNEYRQALGTDIRRRRCGGGFKMAQFGKRIKLGVAHLSRLETGLAGPRSDTLLLLGRALGVRPSTLLAAAEAKLGIGPRSKPGPELPASMGPAVYRRGLGMAVRRHRQRLGLTGRQFSRLIGLSAPQVTRLELGEQGFLFDVLLRTAAALGMRPSELLAAAEPKTRQ